MRVLERLVQAIDPTIEIQAVDGDIADPDVAEQLIDTDVIFLATDTTEPSHRQQHVIASRSL